MRRTLALVLFLSAGLPVSAQADWLIIPFLGTTFKADTSFFIPEAGADRKLTLGGSVLLIGSGLLGLEADIGHTPRFFEGDDPLGLVLTSRVTTLGGNLVIAAPLALTRESLRPYMVAGMGLLQARSRNAGGLFPVDRDLSAVTLGLGALGFVSDRTGLRFDVRRIRSTGGEADAFGRPPRLRFWRATVGVVLRF
jgi:hypothetical protein